MVNCCMDLNCDLGEGMPYDASIIPFISSANIACGYHAGNDDTMVKTVALCKLHQVAVGAHVSYLDKENFGRKNQSLPAIEIEQLILAQLEALENICTQWQVTLHHVKPHGALYNQSAGDENLAEIIAKTIQKFNPNLFLYGLAGSASVRQAAAIGLPVVEEYFADRRYQPNGNLVSRQTAGSLIIDSRLVVAQATQIVLKGMAFTPMLNEVSLPEPIYGKRTICIHSDHIEASHHAKLLHESLSEIANIQAP